MSKKLARLGCIFLLCMLVLGQSVGALTPQERANLRTPFYDEEQALCTTATSALVPADVEANAKIVWDFLISKGLTEPQVAGILGNIQVESGGTFDPRVVEYGYRNSRGEISVAGQPSSLDDNIPPDQPSLRDGRMRGQPGYGLIQWTGGRKHALADFAIQQNAGPGTLPLQLEFLWHELNTTYKSSVLDFIMASQDYAAVSDRFLERFEVPADIAGTRPGRRANALNWLNKFGGSTITTAQTGAAGAGCSGGAVALDPNGCPSEPVTAEHVVTVEGITVHPCIAEEVARLVQLARSQGLDLGGGGWRDPAQQIALRIAHCGSSNYAIYEAPASSCSPPTARPGSSNHERGSAVDFTCGGGSISSHSSPCFIFLRDNTSLKNLPSEPWHWSINGG